MHADRASSVSGVKTRVLSDTRKMRWTLCAEVGPKEKANKRAALEARDGDVDGKKGRGGYAAADSSAGAVGLETGSFPAVRIAGVEKDEEMQGDGSPVRRTTVQLRQLSVQSWWDIDAFHRANFWRRRQCTSSGCQVEPISDQTNMLNTLQTLVLAFFWWAWLCPSDRRQDNQPICI